MVISIHPLRAERDNGKTYTITDYPISIHPLRAERDRARFSSEVLPFLFQSTLSVRRGTLIAQTNAAEAHFNPPSPCGEGHAVHTVVGFQGDFNPPSPCGEGLSRVYISATF